jgi:squalene cyclase
MKYGVRLPLGIGCALLVLAGAARAQTPAVRVADLSPAAEQAIDRGLRFLAEHQNKDGSWGRDHHVANTALALMAFMVKGYFPEKEPYGDVMTRGLDVLLREARGGGYMGRSMYEHGLATLALSEVWGQTSRSDEVRDVLKKAVGVILRSQSGEGGWRYQPDGRDADISVTVMQLVALASAKEAGILVPDETITRATRYIKSCQNSNGGFGYRGPYDPGFARTAAGVTSLLMCGEKNSEAVRRGLDYLMKMPESKFQTGNQWYHYGHYYAVQAMYQAGESYYQEWYPRLRDALVSSQGRDGSWTGRGEYCTPMSILILGVPYRFLPIYQR